MSETNGYQKSYRHLTVDMHTTDWDERCLAKYDPKRMAALCVKGRVGTLLFHCLSHVGLCYWPSKCGEMHRALRGRDLVGETIAALTARGIGVCGYYSLIFDRWAFLKHPEWRMQPPGDTPENPASYRTSRFGHVCPNHPEYRDHVMRQIEELAGGYAFDGMFYDMPFWPRLCLCPSCRDRYRRETGAEVPETIDWFAEDWCRFQAARERWMGEFARAVTAKTKACRPGIAVFNNSATIINNWINGIALDQIPSNDFMLADFYGDAGGQLFCHKLMLNLTPNRPYEFSTNLRANTYEHEQAKSEAEITTLVQAALLHSASFLMIDVVNADGTLYPGFYERIGRIFRQVERYEPDLGGEPVEDIAVYFSLDSRVSFCENGKSVNPPPPMNNDYPHFKAVSGFCRLLQRAHLPFGVITRKQLAELDRYAVVILPNVLRLDAEEAAAFREYARRGGRLYASRYTSLVETRGVRRPDFMLADVFGCHFGGDDLSNTIYLKPATEDVAACIHPQGYIGHFFHWAQPGPTGGLGLRLDTRCEGEVLATLTLPITKQWGSVFDDCWTNPFMQQPWEDTATPALVRHRFGAGRTIYCATDIECADHDANRRLLLRLVHELMDGRPPRYSAETHPAVWMTVADQRARSRYLIGLLNYQALLPPVPLSKVPIVVRPPAGRKFTRLLELPRRKPVLFETDADGALRAMVRNLKDLRLLVAEYA